MAASQQAIADRVGVSRTAVTHVLNGRGHMVGEAVRERILAAAAECDYHRNVLVRGMQRRRTRVIGLVVTRATGYFSRLVMSIETAAKSHGYQCFLCQTHSSTVNMEKEVATLREYRVDGLILMPVNSMVQPEVYRRLLTHRVPFVVLDMAVAGVKAPCAQTDNVAIGRLATQHLLELGHRRIACVKGYWDALNARERVAGYKQALRAAGLAVRDPLLVDGGYIPENGRVAVRELLARKARFTALVAPNDVVALGAIQELRLHGFRVPEDVSVVGCGDDESCEWVTPRLTSVDQKPDDLGRAAFELLHGQLENGVQQATQVMIQPTLVVRESTAANAGKEKP